MGIAVGVLTNLQGAVKQPFRFKFLSEMVENLDLHFHRLGNRRMLLCTVDPPLHRHDLVNGFKCNLELTSPTQDLTLQLKHAGNVRMGRLTKDVCLQLLRLIQDLLCSHVFLLLIKTCRQPDKPSKVLYMLFSKVVLRDPQRSFKMLYSLAVLTLAPKETCIVVVRSSHRLMLLGIEFALDL